MKKNLGQHFLASDSIAMAIVETLLPKKSDVVVEIGPGTGILTTKLAERAKKVFAIEKDGVLAKELKRSFLGKPLVVVEGDVRDFNPRKLGLSDYLLIGNIPYYITGQIIRLALSANPQPKRAVFMVQKEVAERIVAKNGKESILSISVKAYGNPHLIRVVKRGSFRPPPKVDSAILAIENISRDFFKNIDEKEFFALVRKGFAHKRKLLKNNIGVGSVVLERCGLDQNTRAEDLSPAEWKCLTKESIKN